jgi:hypothetical protein
MGRAICYRTAVFLLMNRCPGLDWLLRVPGLRRSKYRNYQKPAPQWQRRDRQM